jgi:hypothetical protein
MQFAIFSRRVLGALQSFLDFGIVERSKLLHPFASSRIIEAIAMYLTKRATTMSKGGTRCPQRVGKWHAALPPNFICAFGGRQRLEDN